MSLTVHLALVFHIFIAVAVMVMVFGHRVCGRHGRGHHGTGPTTYSVYFSKYSATYVYNLLL